MRFLPLALGLSFLRSVVAAPTRKQALDLAQVARSVSNSSSSNPGTISIPFKKHRRSKNGQHKSKRADQLGAVHMSEIGDYIYFGILKIASQEFTVQLDTGSSLTIVYGSDFFSSSNTDLTQDTPKANSFDPSQSSTFSFLDIDSVTYHYVADFFRANIAQDTITFGGYELGNAPFALATSGNVSFQGGDGLIGLSFSPLNSLYGQADSSYTLPLVEILWHLNLLSEPLFSFNMFTQSFNPLLDSPPYPPTPGGELLLGGVDESLFEGDIVYSPLVVDASRSTDYPSTWTTTVQGVIINGNLLPNSRFDAVFDTGTANSQLPQSILNNLFAELDTVKYPVYIAPGPYGTSYSFECPDDFPQFTYSLIFGNQQFDLAFANLIGYRFSTKEGKVICQLAQTSDADDEPDKFVIGDDILRAFYMVYRFAPPSIGIAKLSNKVTNSLDPIPVDLKHISIHTSNPSPISELGIGSATRPVLYTPNPYPTAATFLSTDETLYWDTSTYNLLRQPTFLGTAPIPSPTFTAQATGTSDSGNGGNGDTSGSKTFQHSGLAGVSIAALLGLLLPLLL